MLVLCVQVMDTAALRDPQRIFANTFFKKSWLFPSLELTIAFHSFLIIYPVFFLSPFIICISIPAPPPKPSRSHTHVYPAVSLLIPGLLLTLGHVL